MEKAIVYIFIYHLYLILVLIPRYVRVNQHKSTVDDMIKSFEKEGYKYIETPQDLKTLR